MKLLSKFMIGVWFVVGLTACTQQQERCINQTFFDGKTGEVRVLECASSISVFEEIGEDNDTSTDIGGEDTVGDTGDDTGGSSSDDDTGGEGSDGGDDDTGGTKKEKKTKPGWGHGDKNHEHTGPPGLNKKEK